MTWGWWSPPACRFQWWRSPPWSTGWSLEPGFNFFFFVQISIILIVVQNWWNPFSILKVLYYSSRIKLVHCFKFKFSVDSDPSTVLGNCVTQGLRDSRTRERSPYQCWKNHQKEEKTTEREGKRYRVEILIAKLSQVLSGHHSKAGRQALSGDTSILVM